MLTHNIILETHESFKVRFSCECNVQCSKTDFYSFFAVPWDTININTKDQITQVLDPANLRPTASDPQRSFPAENVQT